ncbi:MAG TPA: hypothetical protein VEZ40_04775 [Pyrinomonadaceae bacterium]|nr:hypothetical protein [Pyrinomonadaceae bacterium]
MQTNMAAASRLSLSPLGAGDLIDRTIRLYRRHFLTLIRTAAPPVIGSATGSVLWTVSMHAIPATGSGVRLVLYVGMAVVGWLLLMAGSFFFLLVMGGASRNLVMHLLWDEPVAARTIYRSVRARFWGLVGALFLIGLFGWIVGMIIAFMWLLAVVMVAGGALALGGGVTWFGGLLGILLFVLITAAALFLFFSIVGRAAYVPQVMLVEGRGVFEAIGRSITLARGNVRRLTAMFVFTTFATYSALMLFIIPLGWYGYLQGINPLALDQAEWPVWYAVGYQVLTQASSILLAPVWMLGLSLLYVDERVRHEGYDIELMAAQRLGEMPLLPGGQLAPLTPAISKTPAPQQTQTLPPSRPHTFPAPAHAPVAHAPAPADATTITDGNLP